MKFHHFLPQEQLEWMNLVHKYKSGGFCEAFPKGDSLKKELEDEYKNWNKHDFSKNAIDASKLTKEQKNQLNVLVADPKWQKYISAQSSCEFLKEKYNWTESEIPQLQQKVKDINEKLNEPNPFENNRNWFQRRYSIFRIKENKYYKNLNKDLKTSKSTQIKLEILSAKLLAQMVELDKVTKKFECENEQVILNIFPKGSNGISPAVHQSEATQGLLSQELLSRTNSTPAATTNQTPQQQRASAFLRESGLPLPQSAQPMDPERVSAFLRESGLPLPQSVQPIASEQSATPLITSVFTPTSGDTSSK